MAAFSWEAGITVSVCPTIWALRMRVSMSETGSVMLIWVSLPARLDHAGHFALEREVAQLVATQAEFLVHAARPAGEGAAAADAHRRRVARQLLQLVARGLLGLVGGARILQDLEQGGALRLEFLHHLLALVVAQLECELGHAWSSVLEREAERGEQRARLVVRLRGRGDGDVHAPERVDLVVLDLREDDLFLEAQAVVAAAVERAVGNAAEVADARHRDVHQAVEELVHARAAQRHHAADRETGAQLEVGDRAARLGDHRLLAGDLLRSEERRGGKEWRGR